jgi:lincosamide nucleotidyltransferase A/C/D/E
MTASEVLKILDTLTASDIKVWLDGGWGVDALLGTQTREHEDVDLVVELQAIPSVIATLEPLSFSLAEDHLPTRAVLRTADHQQVDLHPVTFAADGTAWQRGANPDGSDCPYPAGGFGEGRILGQVVRCLPPALQLEHHGGYVPRERDVADIQHLARRFGLALPESYRTGGI